LFCNHTLCKKVYKKIMDNRFESQEHINLPLLSNAIDMKLKLQKMSQIALLDRIQWFIYLFIYISIYIYPFRFPSLVVCVVEYVNQNFKCVSYISC